MQLKTFVLPIKNLSAAEVEMNAFLRSHRMLAVKKEFVADGENSSWTFCVEYLDGTPPSASPVGGRAPKVDYKEVLKPEELARRPREAIKSNNTGSTGDERGFTISPTGPAKFFRLRKTGVDYFSLSPQWGENSPNQKFAL